MAAYSTRVVTLVLLSAILVGQTHGAIGTAKTAPETLINSYEHLEKYSADKRSATEKPLYSVTIFSRPPSDESAFGHAYIAIHRFREDVGSFIRMGPAFGFYPLGDLARIGPVPDTLKSSLSSPGGMSVGPSDEKPATVVYVWVDEEQVQKINEIKKQWEKEGQWQLLLSDCVSFVAAVAKELGMKVPSRIVNPKPDSYVRSLGRLNDSSYIETKNKLHPARREDSSNFGWEGGRWIIPPLLDTNYDFEIYGKKYSTPWYKIHPKWVEHAGKQIAIAREKERKRERKSAIARDEERGPRDVDDGYGSSSDSSCSNCGSEGGGGGGPGDVIRFEPMEIIGDKPE